MPTLQKKNAAFLFLFLLLLVSCDPKRVFEENKAIPDRIWRDADKLVFQVDVNDTGIPYNIYLMIRNGTDYPYSNLYLFLKTTLPDGKISRDTIECMLADYDGRWLGSGIGSVKFNKFQFKKGILFSQKGRYLFEFDQAMRVNALQGITDMGLRIDR
ncbi:MAG: gliding motility lipoprotein GldH [bacterium]